MKASLVIGIIIVTAIAIITMIPVVMLTKHSLTHTYEDCQAIDGEYVSQFMGPAKCFVVVDGHLVDTFND